MGSHIASPAHTTDPYRRSSGAIHTSWLHLELEEERETESLNMDSGHLEFINYVLLPMETSLPTVGEGSPV